MASVSAEPKSSLEEKEGGDREALDVTITKPHKFSDVVLLVEGRKLFTNKYLLSMISPVFRAMFTQGLEGATCSEVSLPSKRYEDVLEMLLQVYPSHSRSLSAEKATRLFGLFHDYKMEGERQRCLAAMLDELKSRDVGQTDAPSVALHHDCVEVACAYHVTELYNACVDVAIDHPATHYDALVYKMAMVPADCLQIFATKMKRVAYEHRNKRPFKNRNYRQCDAYTDPAACVDYVHSSSEKIILGF